MTGEIDDRKTYKGFGFAESLIALVVVGIVGIILIQIASGTLRELILLDIEDTLARYAVSTAVDLQRIAIEDMKKEEEDKAFEMLSQNETICFGLNRDGTGFLLTPKNCPSEVNNNGKDYRNDYSSVYNGRN